MLKSVILLFSVAVQLISGDDVCLSPFSSFLQCMADDADQKLGRYLKELSPQVETQVQQCFIKSNCEAPDFSNATVEAFLQPPWAERAKVILDLLENMDPKVKSCMIEFFKGIIRKQIDECIQRSGPSDIKDFQTPPLPDIKNFDISKFKQLVLHRMLVRIQVPKCEKAQGRAAANQTIECIAAARKEHDQTLCTTREQCRQSKIADESCRTRFDKIHETACECIREAKAHNVSFNASGPIQMLLTGGLEKQFKKCHEDNQVEYPQAKVDNVKKVIGGIVAEFVSNPKIPPQVKKTLRIAHQSMRDIEQQWKGAFCAKCSKDGDQSTLITDREIHALKRFLGEKDADED